MAQSVATSGPFRIGGTGASLFAMKSTNALLLAPILALPLLAACSTTPDLPDGLRIGEPIEAQESVRFSVVDADPEPFFERVVLVEASVTAVCANAGCWMQVEDEGRSAMVRWETGCGGKYLFPTELEGKRVLVQGSFYPKQLTEDEVIHLEVEAGRELNLERDGYEFNASAILVLD